MAKAADVFAGEPRPDEPTVDLEVLHAKNGQLVMENDSQETLSAACNAKPNCAEPILTVSTPTSSTTSSIWSASVSCGTGRMARTPQVRGH